MSDSRSDSSANAPCLKPRGHEPCYTLPHVIWFRTMLFFRVFSCDFRVPSPCRDTKCEMTRRLAAKVASAVRQRFVKSSSLAPFKRVSQRVISAAAPLGKATGFCVSARRARLVGCSAGRMAAHIKAAPDDNVLRLIDRALGKLNDSAGCSPRPGLVAQAPRPQASAADGGV